MNRQPRKATCIASLAAMLFIAATQPHAGDASVESTYRAEAGEPLKRASTGPFFGHDQATGKIWINDFAYQLHADYRVIGSSTKLGLLSAIRYGEMVTFETAPNPKQPSTPYVIKIHRK